MKRNLLAGISLAGALTILGGVAAFAEPDEAEPGAALVQQAEQKAHEAMVGIHVCARVEMQSLRTQQKPANVTQQAWDQAVEQAQGQVETLVETADQQIETAAENFDNAVEAAAENGTALPSLTTLTASLTKTTTDTCTAISNVKVTVSTVTPPAPKGDDEKDTESEHHDTEQHDSESQHSSSTERD